MVLPLPETLSPSKVSSFSDCALAFRLSAIDKLPEPPSIAATRGTLVHLALQHLLDRPAEERDRSTAELDLDRAIAEMSEDPELTGLGLDEDALAEFFAEARRLLDRYFEIEDPSRVEPIGLEVMLEAQVDGLRLRGIIDRLELDEDGGLVVTDYKTGRSPRQAHTKGRLGGVTFYALLCHELFGRMPSRIRLMYLGDGVIITTEPTEQSIRGLRSRIGAMWQAISRACETGDFRPRPGPLCDWCAFQAYCPAMGGDLEAIPALDAS